MNTVKFTIKVANTNYNIKIADNSTNWVRVDYYPPTTLTIYFRGEDKSSYIAKRSVTSPTEIANFMNTELVLTFAELFNTATPDDGFYQVDVVADEGTSLQMLSSPMAICFTYFIAKLIYNNTLGVNVPVNDLETSLTLGMMHQSLELLNTLSTDAEYSYDRENKWRKLFNYLTTVVNDITY